MATLEIDRLQKRYGASHVVKDFSLDIAQGEFVSFLGPSGCGKTTTLRMVAGFETPDEGAIRIDGRDVVRLRPSARKIGMVFQSYALFPNLTVADNVAFGLKVAGRPRAEIAPRVAEMLRLIGLPELGGRYPFQLSGGQQQRVALARALAVRPRVLLLDEPLSALDAKIRISLRTEIREIQRELGITTIYVTHDQEEALSMSDRIVVMNAGRAEQVGTPFEIYNRPATRFVATFVGSLNTLAARVVEPARGLLAIGGQRLPLGRPVALQEGAEAALALRPEAIALGSRDGALALRARVAALDFHGPVLRLRLALEGQTLSLDVFNRAGLRPPSPGDVVDIAVDPADILLTGPDAPGPRAEAAIPA